MVKLDFIMIGNSGSGKTSLVNCYQKIDDEENINASNFIKNKFRGFFSQAYVHFRNQFRKEKIFFLRSKY